jgi:hypothetical protein
MYVYIFFRALILPVRNKQLYMYMHREREKMPLGVRALSAHNESALVGELAA